MWSRSQLKERAKNALRQNYWKTVLVTLIVFLIGGATTTFNFKDSNDDNSDSDFFYEFEQIWENNSASDNLLEFDTIYLIKMLAKYRILNIRISIIEKMILWIVMFLI